MFNIFAVADTMQRVNKENIQLSSLYVSLSFFWTCHYCSCKYTFINDLFLELLKEC